MSQWTRFGFVAVCSLLGTSCSTELRQACPPGSDTTASVRCGEACATGELSADICVLVRVACDEGRLTEDDCVGVDGDMGVPDDMGAADDMGVPADMGPRDEGVDAGPCGMACSGGRVCNAALGLCTECASVSDCSAPEGLCNAGGACVECLGDGDCAGGRCLAGTCVECVGNADCGATEPKCNLTSHECEACTARADCLLHAVTPACNVATGACALCDVPNESADCSDLPGSRCFSPTMCTECRAGTGGDDCQNPMEARCNSVGECAPCMNSTDCSHVAGRGVCNAGTCVQCTIATETARCGGNSCNPATSMCTTTPRLSGQQCESCVADSECSQSGGTFRCIPMNYQGAPRGGYCMRAVNAGGGSSGCTRPFFTGITIGSLSGASSATYCGIDQNSTSCDAVHALQASWECLGGDASECMADGARCETVDLAPLSCTYSCSVANNCPGTLVCNAGFCGS